MPLGRQGSVARGNRVGRIGRSRTPGTQGDAQNPNVELFKGEPELYPSTTSTTQAPTTSTLPPVTTTSTAPPVVTTSTSTTQAPTTSTIGPTTTSSTAPAMLDLDFGCTDLYGTNLVCQSLTPDVTWDIGAIRIGVLYTNASDGDVRLTLWTHEDANNPYNGTLLGTSQEVAVDQSPAEAYVFNFSTPVQVGQKFWVVIEPRGTATGVWTNREATNQYPGGHIGNSGTPTGTSWIMHTIYDICDLQVYGTSPGPTTSTSTSTTQAPTTSTLAPTTSTTFAPEFILPDGDVSGTFATFGSGTGRWDRLNDGIDSGTPDDTNGIVGQSDNARMTFESPSFPGNCSEIIVRYRARNQFGSDGVRVQLYSDGSNSDGNSDLEFPGSSFGDFEYSYSISKTAAQLANLEVNVQSLSGSEDDDFSEVEVEIRA